MRIHAEVGRRCSRGAMCNSRRHKPLLWLPVPSPLGFMVDVADVSFLDTVQRIVEILLDVIGALRTVIDRVSAAMPGIPLAPWEELLCRHCPASPSSTNKLHLHTRSRKKPHPSRRHFVVILGHRSFLLLLAQWPRRISRCGPLWRGRPSCCALSSLVWLPFNLRKRSSLCVMSLIL